MMKTSFLLFLGIILISMNQYVMAQTQSEEKAVIIHKTTLNYLLWLPSEYKKEKKKTYPLLIFLHGPGEQGDTLDLVKKHGPPSFVESKPDFPFITVSPQCPLDQWWNVEDLQQMLEQLLKIYRVDTRRIYLTGLSKGGFGTWSWASKFPDQFADELKNTPILAFHGEADPVVPVKRTIEMVEAANANGGSARMTIYPGVGHDSWVNAYNDEELYKWLLSNKKKE